MTASGRRRARFGIFEFEFAGAKLHRHGREVALQQQQAMLLALLLERTGQIVTRDELRAAIWPSGTYVEFDLGLNTAISRLRRALGDSATEPRFIETIPKQGYRFIAPLEVMGEAAPEPVPVTPPADPAPRPTRRWIPVSLAALAVMAAIGGFLRWRSRPATETPGGRIVRYSIQLSPGQQLESLTISPGGEQIVYQAAAHGTRMLYRRFLDEEDARPIPGTESGEQPFFSPDGKTIGYYAAESLRLTGPSGTRDIAPVPKTFDLRRAFWAPDGFIYFTSTDANSNEPAPPAAIWRVAARGGSPELVLKSRQTEKGSLVPFGQDYLASPPSLLYSTVISPLERFIEWRDLSNPSAPPKPLVGRGMGGQILPTGHLLYFWRGSLLAARFDPESRTLKGSPVEVVPAVAANGWRGPRAAVSRNGTLAYVKEVQPRRRLLWVARTGQESPLPLPVAAYEQAEVSPDGKRLLIARRDDANRWTLWVHHLQTGAWTRLADVPVPSTRGLWSPDGRSVIASMVEGDTGFVNLYRIPVDSPDHPERLTTMPDFGQYPLSWSAAANAVLFVEGVHAATQSDIHLLPLTGDRRPRPLVQSPSPDTSPAFSPDGRWFAYSSLGPGGAQVFVQPVDLSSPARKISPDGGRDPLWAPDGKHVYYIRPGGALFEATLDAHANPTAATQLLPEGFAEPRDWWTRPFSLAPDGRFLVIRAVPGDNEVRAQIHVIVNWFQELERLAP